MTTSKFKVGEQVDFLNPHNVLFKEHTIKNIEKDEKGETRYFLDTSCYWISKPESCLFYPGTYAPPSPQEIVLNNGEIAKFSHYSDWGEKVFIMKIVIERAAVLVDRVFYSLSDYDEASFPLPEIFQPKKDIQ